MGTAPDFRIFVSAYRTFWVYNGAPFNFVRLRTLSFFVCNGFPLRKEIEIMTTIFQNSYVHIVLSSVAVYVFIILAIRLFGKKELAQLSVYDLVFILLISNAVQNAMVGSDSTLLGGLVAAASLFVLNYIIKQLQFRFPLFGTAIQGEALMLVFKGKILDSHLKRARISEAELMEVIREHGVAAVSEVDLAVLEVDGNISILSTDNCKKTTRRRKAHKVVSKQQ
jgi:uncharacterized membrane protein YcaP (DUF421 family)